MLTITEAAGELLVELLEEAEAPEGVAARFVNDGSELSLALSQACADDVVFEHAGTVVLVLDEAMSDSLTNRILDVEEAQDGPQLVLADFDPPP